MTKGVAVADGLHKTVHKMLDDFAKAKPTGKDA